MLIHELLSFFDATYLILIIFQGVLSFSSFRKLRPLEKMIEIFNTVPNVSDSRKPIILTLIWMTYMELITRESETILPLFLSYSILLSSLLLGVKIYKTFYRSRDRDCCVIWHLGWVTVIIVNKYSFKTAFWNINRFITGSEFRKSEFRKSKFLRTQNLRSLEKRLRFSKQFYINDNCFLFTYTWTALKFLCLFIASTCFI